MKLLSIKYTLVACFSFQWILFSGMQHQDENDFFFADENRLMKDEKQCLCTLDAGGEATEKSLVRIADEKGSRLSFEPDFSLHQWMVTLIRLL